VAESNQVRMVASSIFVRVMSSPVSFLLDTFYGDNKTEKQLNVPGDYIFADLWYAYGTSVKCCTHGTGWYLGHCKHIKQHSTTFIIAYLYDPEICVPAPEITYCRTCSVLFCFFLGGFE